MVLDYLYADGERKGRASITQIEIWSLVMHANFAQTEYLFRISSVPFQS